MSKDLTCIVCPNGCLLKVEQNGNDIEVFDAGCNRGIEFAKNEMTNPTRSITSTVATIFEDFPLLPVKTDGELPKDKIFEAMKLINSITVRNRLKVGDIVWPDVFGVNVVATSSMNKNIEKNRYNN